MKTNWRRSCRSTTLTDLSTTSNWKKSSKLILKVEKRFRQLFNGTNQFYMPRRHNSPSHYNKNASFVMFVYFFLWIFRQIFACFSFVYKKNWLVLFKNVRNVSNNRVNLFHFLYSGEGKRAPSLVIYRELRLPGEKESKKTKRRKRRKQENRKNQNGKLMANRSNNTKLSFRLIGQSWKKKRF